ncbi:MAG TPA: PEP-CTERM/exosortase system-associated acyltransferase [Stellaceae bacterium]|nr:PEP-CTERM/exosortase system-associated acyltransferase [Stellaceae bacterium]
MTELISDFTNCYERYFKVLKADTPNLLDQVYRLRYQLFCVENPIFDPAEHLDERERDEYDERSAHILLVHRDSGAAIGTARLILPRRGDRSGPLLIQRLLAPGDRKILEHLPPRRTAEISRFAIGKELRRHWRSKSAHRTAFPDMPRELQASERLLMRYITFGLLRGILDACMEHTILYLAAVMEPTLIRALVWLGIDFEPVGGRIDYYGVRQPCVVRLADLVERSRGRRTPLWQYLNSTAGL